MRNKFSLQFIHMQVSNHIYKWGASARECFPIQFTNSFLPLLGAFLYNPTAETTKLNIVTSHHHVLIVQGVDYHHVLQIEKNSMEMQCMIMRADSAEPPTILLPENDSHAAC